MTESINTTENLYEAAKELIVTTEELATIVHLISHEQSLAINKAKEALTAYEQSIEQASVSGKQEKEQVKTKEEILHDLRNTKTVFHIYKELVYEAMQIYSDQQTAPLQSEITRLKAEKEEYQRKWFVGKLLIDEITDGDHFKQKQGRRIVTLKAEITELKKSIERLKEEIIRLEMKN
jgi:uncharacterized small protein (DUF1192 family)